MNLIKQISLTGLLLFLFFNIFSQTYSESSDEAVRRKFDYYYYAGLNAKALNNYDEAYDLFQHCYAIDSTNATVLVELAAFHNVSDDREGAWELVSKAVQYDPDNYYYNMILADLGKSLDFNDEVIEIYNKLLKLYPERVDIFFELSGVYSSMDEWDKAIESLDSLQKYTGSNDAVAMNKFRIYKLAGEKEKAFKEIETIVEENPENIQYVLMVGELYLDDYQQEKALEYFKKAESIDAESPALILSMVKYYEKTGNREASIEEIQKAIANSKMDLETKMQLLSRYIALLNQSKQDLDAAQPLFQSLFEQYPNNSEINMIYGEILLMQDKQNEALIQFETYVQDYPEDPTGYDQMLRILLPDTTATEKIIEVAEKGIKNIPDAPQFYFYLALIRAQQDKYKQSLQIFEQGLENAEFRNPMIKSDFYGQMGDINYMMKNEQTAFEFYEKALDINPQNLPVLNNYSYYLSLKRKDLDRAEKMSAITVKAEPTNATYLDTYGWVLFEQGAYTMAKIYIEKAIEYGEEDEISAEVWEHYGDILAVTGDLDKAVEQWKRARAEGGKSKVLKKKIRKKKYYTK